MRTPSERAKHWRDEAEKLCGAQEEFVDMDEQNHLEVVSALLKACRYTLRVPEGTSIIEFLRELEIVRSKIIMLIALHIEDHDEFGNAAQNISKLFKADSE